MISGISDDVAFGFGSFVDKPTYPYVRTDEYLQPTGPVAPYSFTHHMNISTDIDQYSGIINGLKISTNEDPPEGIVILISQTGLFQKNF